MTSGRRVGQIDMDTVSYFCVCRSARMKFLLVFFTALSVSSVNAAPFRGMAQFRSIPASDLASSLPHSNSTFQVYVTAISGDGSTIGGHTRRTNVAFDCARNECGTKAFIWSHADRRQMPLGNLSLHKPYYPVRVTGLSFDSSKALVTYENREYVSAIVENGLPTALRTPTVPGEWNVGSAMSLDGATVVGTHRTQADINAFVVTPEGEQTIADPGDKRDLHPTDVSQDGRVVVANRQDGLFFFTTANNIDDVALLYSEQSGFTDLPPLEGYDGTRATAISADGRSVVGTSQRLPLTNKDFGTTSAITLWRDGQPQLLSSAYAHASPLDISGAGDFVVGTHTFYSPFTDAFFYPEAMLWNSGNSYRLQTLLEQTYGLQEVLAGWRLTEATAISFDGRVIAGQGLAPDGKHSAWIVRFSIPEPSTTWLVLLALLGLPLCREWI